MSEMTNERIEECPTDYGLQLVIDYNGLTELVRQWLTIEPNARIIYCPYWDQVDHNTSAYHQLQVLWMICVAKFGEYGTSPRFGWITDVDGFREFIEKIAPKEETYD